MPRLQFSMRWMLAAITIACVLLFLYVTFGNFIEIAVAILLCGILPTPLVVFAIYARGDAQAFAIGSLVPLVTLGIFRFPISISPITGALWLIPVCLICGVIGAVTHGWIKSSFRE